MAYIGDKDYLVEVARGNVSGVEIYNKSGANIDIDTASTPEDVWGYNGVYTGFDATSGEAIEVLGGAGTESGTLVSSGTATSGSATLLEDSTATFITDGVAVGDLIINDTQQIHGVVSVVTSETTLTAVRFSDGVDVETSYSVAVSDAYRVATPASTGAAVVKLNRILESDYLEYKSEYVILNGGTPVDTVGTDYIRCSEMRVVLSGSGGTNTADIQARQTTTTANVFSYILTNHGKSLMAGDTIPKGKSLYITNIHCKMARVNGSPGAAEVDFKIKRINESWQAEIHEYISNSADFDSEDGYVLPIPEYTDFIWSVEDVSDNNTQISAQINGVLVTNE